MHNTQWLYARVDMTPPHDIYSPWDCLPLGGWPGPEPGVQNGTLIT